MFFSNFSTFWRRILGSYRPCLLSQRRRDIVQLGQAVWNGELNRCLQRLFVLDPISTVKRYWKTQHSSQNLKRGGKVFFVLFSGFNKMQMTCQNWYIQKCLFCNCSIAIFESLDKCCLFIVFFPSTLMNRK